jgi:hypothetical protein
MRLDERWRLADRRLAASATALRAKQVRDIPQFAMFGVTNITSTCV